MITPVFLDASFWIALRDPREPWHTRAQQATRTILSQKLPFIFTSFVLAETHANFTRAPKIRIQILNDAQRNPTLRSEQVLPADEAQAIELLRRQHDKNYSYCDAVSFMVMRRLGLRRAASFDEHFRQFGEFEIIS